MRCYFKLKKVQWKVPSTCFCWLPMWYFVEKNGTTSTWSNRAGRKYPFWRKTKNHHIGRGLCWKKQRRQQSVIIKQWGHGTCITTVTFKVTHHLQSITWLCCCLVRIPWFFEIFFTQLLATWFHVSHGPKNPGPLLSIWILVVSWRGPYFMVYEIIPQITGQEMPSPTWRIIPVGKWLVTPIYKPWNGHL